MRLAPKILSSTRTRVWKIVIGEAGRKFRQERFFPDVFCYVLSPYSEASERIMAGYATPDRMGQCSEVVLRILSQVLG